MAFDYDSPDASAETIAAVVSEMSRSGSPDISDEEREQRQIEHERFVAESRERDRQQRLEYERRRSAAAGAERAEAERQAAIARSERNERLRQEIAEQSRRQTRDRSLTSLLDLAVQQRQFRDATLRSAAHANARQRLKSLLNPPQPPEPLPEPEMPEPEPLPDPPIGQGWPKIKSWW